MQEKRTNVKDQVLYVLESRKGEDVSGRRMADMIGVSRTAIWKAVRSLQEMGYVIEAGTNRGYCLSVYNDILSESGIRANFDDECKDLPIHIYDSLESTNKTAMQLALEDTPSGTIVIADAQTSGRGRIKRSFFSPKGAGVYFSILIRPNFQKGKPTLIMTAVCVAVCMAIEKLYKDLTPGIKWINDVFINGKKICGILTDGLVNFETGEVDFLIIGIGINFKNPVSGFPAELERIATSLGAVSPDSMVSRNELIAEIVNQLKKIIADIHDKDFLAEYRKRSLLFNKRIIIRRKDKTIRATALDIDNAGGLLVRLDDGRTQLIYNTEVSIQAAQ